jgi:capsular polysaccharide biosynthesis protein
MQKNINKTSPKVLGLDVSTRTIGWALFDIQTKELKAGRLNLFRTLWVQDYLALDVPHPSVLFIREQMLNKVANEGLTSNSIKLGILRKTTLRRRIVNEVDYINWCTGNGIQLIDPGDYSFMEQVALFSKANFLIAPHGAGETNMLFMRPNSIIIEINNEKASEATLCYLSLAGHLSFRFYYLPAKVQGYDLEFDVEYATKILIKER